jgi:hypothetical protein
MLALAAWKFKFLAFMVPSKGKLLLLGLIKASTFLSLFAMVGVYWTAFGFWFALGLVLSIYILTARALFDKPSDRPDRGALVHYIALVAALSLLAFAPALRFR